MILCWFSHLCQISHTSATERWEEHTQDYHMGPKKSVKYAQSQAIPSSNQATGLELVQYEKGENICIGALGL